MDKFDELQRQEDSSNQPVSRRTSLYKSYWFNIKDNEKLDFNQDMAGIFVGIIQSSLTNEFVSWKTFNVKMKEDYKDKLKDELK